MLTFIKFPKKTTYIKIQPVNSTNAICFVGVLAGWKHSKPISKMNIHNSL